MTYVQKQHYPIYVQALEDLLKDNKDADPIKTSIKIMDYLASEGLFDLPELTDKEKMDLATTY